MYCSTVRLHHGDLLRLKSGLSRIVLRRSKEVGALERMSRRRTEISCGKRWSDDQKASPLLRSQVRHVNTVGSLLEMLNERAETSFQDAPVHAGIIMLSTNGEIDMRAKDMRDPECILGNKYAKFPSLSVESEESYHATAGPSARCVYCKRLSVRILSAHADSKLG